MPEKKGEYPTGEARTKGPKGTKDAKEAIKETKPMSLLEEDMLLDLTYDELKQAFRCRKKTFVRRYSQCLIFSGCLTARGRVSFQ